MGKLAGAAAYIPGEPPNDPALLPRYLREELAKITAALNELRNVQLPVMYAPPSKPRNGMLANADGTTWNPGSGEGIYRFAASTNTWNFLG